MNKNKVITLIACILICAAMAFSFIFIAIESDHDCVEDSCHICAEIQSCKLLIRTMGNAFVSIFLFSHIAVYISYFFKTSQLTDRLITLVTLKVKLTN